MSKEMENHSLNDRHSTTGNSGLLSLTSLKTKLQPIRVQALMEMYGSDEEESEERGKESDNDSDCDDIQPLPNDDEEIPEAQKLPSLEINEIKDNRSNTADDKIIERQFETLLELQEKSPIKKENIKVTEHVYTLEKMHSTSNFSLNEHSHMRLENQRSASFPSESASSSYNAGSSASKSSIERNHGSNMNFKPPEVLYSSNTKSSYTLVNTKTECTLHSSHCSNKSKFETEPSYFPNDRHLHSTNVALQSEAPAATATTVNPSIGTHLITDTPHKNNPVVGSMRPTPSVSHRSMFQTPQSAKLHHQDYSKNHVQTPATIFGNWSQRHMAQTPLQSRSTILPGDNVRGQAPSIIVSQHTAGSNHETPWYRGNEEKKVRRPLGESMQGSGNHQRHSHSEKPVIQYTSTDSSVGTSKHHENPESSQGHGILENIKEISSSKSLQQQHIGMTHEFKENRHPPSSLIERLPSKDEEQGSRGNFESIKESGINSNGNVLNENRLDVARHRIENNDKSASRCVRTNSTAVPKSTAIEADKEKNNVLPKQQANVQLSIPSSIRREKVGETMIVKGKEYLILGGLGQGMSCHVLRVQDLTSLELRAIKVVNLSRMDKDSAQGCMQEISMLHKLQAPCVVRMFDYEIKYPMVHVVMEMGDTDFKSLLNSMSEKKRLPLTMILYYWTEMLTAVKHIHENGVIHSDLKPANFLLVRGRLKLIDFGIASSINADMTSVVKNSTIGTLNYISPEALMDIGSGGNGDSPNHNVKYKITFKSDVWSLGCILYSLVYGYTPFNNIRSQWAKIQAITNPNPKISFALPPGNDVDPPPPILIDVLRKCLQHDPKARPTVTQLLQIPYITTKQNSRAAVPDIPSNILMKIRQSLTDDEWRQFTEIMETRRIQS